MSLRYFGNELYKRSPNTVNAFSWRDCAGFLFVGYWITHCVPCLGCFLVFILCPIVPSIFGTICFVCTQYNSMLCAVVPTFTASLERVQFKLVQSFPVVEVLYFSDFVCKRSLNCLDSLYVSFSFHMDSRAGSSTLVRERQEISRVSAWESSYATETLSTPVPSCLWPF